MRSTLESVWLMTMYKAFWTNPLAHFWPGAISSQTWSQNRTVQRNDHHKNVQWSENRTVQRNCHQVIFSFLPLVCQLGSMPSLEPGWTSLPSGPTISHNFAGRLVIWSLATKGSKGVTGNGSFGQFWYVILSQSWEVRCRWRRVTIFKKKKILTQAFIFEKKKSYPCLSVSRLVVPQAPNASRVCPRLQLSIGPRYSTVDLALLHFPLVQTASNLTQPVSDKIPAHATQVQRVRCRSNDGSSTLHRQQRLSRERSLTLSVIWDGHRPT